MDYIKIKKDVAHVVEKYGTKDPFRLTEECGYQLLFADLDNENLGFRVKHKRISTIVINENTDIDTQKFVCSHEFGHCRVHNGLNVPFLKSHMNGMLIPKIEREANFYAFALLLYDFSIHDFEYYTNSQILKIAGLPRELEYFMDREIISKYILC